METVVDLFALKEFDIWTGSKDKVPYAPELGYNAKSDAPETWTDYKTVKHWSEEQRKLSNCFTYGVNIALKGVPNLCVIDIDKVLDFETGELIENPLAAEILEPFREAGAYIERSISSLGWHIYFYVDYEKLHILNKSEFYEKYSASDNTLHIDFRSGLYAPYFMGFTEMDATGAFKECSEQCLDFLDQYMKRTVNGSPRTFSYSPGILGESWRDRLEMARKSKNGDKFKALYDNGGILNGVMLNGGDKSSNDYALCCLLAFWLNRDPEAMKEAFLASLLGKRFTDPEKTDKKKSRGYVERTIEKAISQQKEVYTPRRGRPKKQEQEQDKEKLPPKAEKPYLCVPVLRDFLEEHDIHLRFNVVTQRVEYTGIQTSLEKAQNNSLILIHSLLKEADLYRGVNAQTVKDFCLSLALEDCYNPVHERISAIKWDEKSRLPLFYELLGAEADEQSQLLFRKWLCSAYAITLNDLTTTGEGKISTEGVLVLVGKQGVGKTSFLRKLFLDGYLFREGLSIADFKNRDALSLLTSTWCVELGEIKSSLSVATMDELKNFITRSCDVWRAPYDAVAETHARRTALSATCNNADFLVDTTGNRRFWTIPADGIKAERMRDLPITEIEQLWAEIQHIVETARTESEEAFNATFRLAAEDLIKLEERNEEHVIDLPGEETVLSLLERLQGDSYNGRKVQHKPMSATELIQANSTNADWTKFTPKQIGAVLAKLARNGVIEQQKSVKVNGIVLKRYPNLPYTEFNTSVYTHEIQKDI